MKIPGLIGKEGSEGKNEKYWYINEQLVKNMRPFD